MPTVYIETSIIGYLAARSAADLLFQARQELTLTLQTTDLRGHGVAVVCGAA